MLPAADRSSLVLLVAAAIAFLVLACPPDASGMFKNQTEPVPAKRVIENLEARLAKRPDDAGSHYALARVHAMLYAREVDSLALEVAPADREDATPYSFPAWESLLVRRGKTALDDAAKSHLLASIRHYERAVALDGKSAIYALGLGWMCENAAGHASALPEASGVTEEKLPGSVLLKWRALVTKLGDDEFAEREKAERALRAELPRIIPFLVDARRTDDAEVVQRINRILAHAWRNAAVAAYSSAYDLAIEGDSAKRFFGPHEDSAVSEEAGGGIVRILERRERSEAEKTLLKRVREGLKDISGKGHAITPVVFPRRGPARLADLLDPSRIVEFDLAGDGRETRWPWVRPDTGILVWDPEGTGRIESGQQLFGSATWWVGWRNGYEALAALDDDGDGRLCGAELDGIAVWTDRDGNGVSDPGEVVPARRDGIESIAVTGVREIDGVPAHPRGIRMTDGRVVPTYDWVARPAD